MQPPGIAQRGLVRLFEGPGATFEDQEGQIGRPRRQGPFLERVEEVDAVFSQEARLLDVGEGERGEDAPVVWDGPAGAQVGERCDCGGEDEGE